MKTFRILLMAPALLVACSKHNPEVAPVAKVTSTQNSVNPSHTPTPSPYLSVDGSTTGWKVAKKCTGGRGRCIFTTTNDSPQRMSPNVRLSVHDGILDVVNLTPDDPSMRDFVLTADDEFYVDVAVANALGYNSIKVLQGAYSEDITQGYGELQMNIEVTNFQ